MAFIPIDFDTKKELTLITSISDVGVSAGGLLANFIKAMPSSSYAQLSLSPSTFSDINFSGELYIFKSAGNELIHKTLIFFLKSAQSSTALDVNNYLIGFIPYNNGTSTAVKWYKPTLTAV